MAGVFSIQRVETKVCKSVRTNRKIGHLYNKEVQDTQIKKEIGMGRHLNQQEDKKCKLK